MGWNYDSSRGYWRKTKPTDELIDRWKKHYGSSKQKDFEYKLSQSAITCFMKYYGDGNYYWCQRRNRIQESIYPTDTIADFLDSVAQFCWKTPEKYPNLMQGEYHQHITEFELKKFRFNSYALKNIALGLDRFECKTVKTIYSVFKKPSGASHFVDAPWEYELDANYELKKLAQVTNMLKEKYGWKKWGYKQLATLYKETLPKVVSEVREILRRFPVDKDTQDSEQRLLNSRIQCLKELSGVYTIEPRNGEVEKRNSPLERSTDDVPFKPTIAEIDPELVKERRAKLTVEQLKYQQQYATMCIADKEAKDAQKMKEFMEKKYEKK